MSDNINYNADELEAPSWLDEQFLQDALVKHFKEPSLIVTDSEISPASVMFRVHVEYSIQKRKFSKSLIIKTMPEAEGHKKEFLADSKIFPTEIAMFTQVLPKFRAILREADELRSVLGKLVKWQAVSFKLLKDQPGIFDELQFDLTTIPNFLEQDFTKDALSNFINMINVIREYRENRQANAYYVLCYGDFHIRNMMFNKDSDCMLLDFQLSYIGSIANDLHYAKYMLLSPNDRKDSCDALLYYYFDTFVRTL
ncbi:uncharacterized protein LOC6572190 [Drosophila mojavensis]|uniref:CHK kinase-like domain-containing protein n=1 Tax=Drosophila mojavensis TaxID=7230 RepID=B4KD30_DROMO|nr:uncharacterized protein LOC6572190 [Drosophila mojavensis]EDW13800.2 uncharacterized protein Dmoj_GI23910 [Drosophila mojavensis]